MTLIVSLKFKGGTILASDTRVMYGLRRKKDSVAKVKGVSRDIAVASAGLVGAIDDINKELMLRFDNDIASFDETVDTLENLVLAWWNGNKAKFVDDETQTRGPDFVLASGDRIRAIYGNGYSEEIYDYSCIGSGENYGDFILQRSFEKEMVRDKAIQLAIYTIVETSRVDPTVGNDVSVFAFTAKKGMEELKRKEIEGYISKFPRNIFARREEEELVNDIVSMRSEINDVFRAKFKFDLFEQYERSVLKLYEPCQNEDEFGIHIEALGLLIDKINGKELKKVLESADAATKTLGLLNKFIESKGAPDFKQLTDGFDKVRMLRSGHFPTHSTEADFVKLVYDLMGNYPPVWPELWIKSLDLYLDSLRRIRTWLETLR